MFIHVNASLVTLTLNLGANSKRNLNRLWQCSSTFNSNKDTQMNYTGRQNYYKYESVKERLQEELNNDRTSSQIIHTLKIAPLTFYKYKNMLQLETGRQFRTTDEQRFIESLGASQTSGHKPDTVVPAQPKQKLPVPAPEPVVQPEPEAVPVEATAAAPVDAPKPTTPSTPSKSSKKKST